MPSSVMSLQPASPPSPPTTPETKLQASRKRNYKKAFKKDGMMDVSRIMLCMFAMSVFFFNPFNLILPQSANSPSATDYQTSKAINSRVLNSIETYDDIRLNSMNSSIESIESIHLTSYHIYLNPILNVILILLCLIIIYINGEPYIDVNLTNDDTLWLNYQMARKNFERKNYEEAANFCEKGLKELGQNIPKTHLQLTIGLIWQVIRLILDKLYIGRLLSKFGIWLYDLKNLKMYKLSALFYYEMHKFSYLNMRSEKEFVLKTTTVGTNKSFGSQSITPSSLTSTPSSYTTTYSYLTALYYLLAAYNMSEIYASKQDDLSLRDEYNLCEMYFSMVLFLKFYSDRKSVV